MNSPVPQCGTHPGGREELWRNHLAFLGLSIPICQMGLKRIQASLFHNIVLRIQGDNLLRKSLYSLGLLVSETAGQALQQPTATLHSSCQAELGTHLPGAEFCSWGRWGWPLTRCDASRNLLLSSCMSCLSAPGGQLGPGRVALHSRLWNDALRWFRPQKPHSADQQRRVPGAHAAVRCVPSEGQRLSGSGWLTCCSSHFLASVLTSVRSRLLFLFFFSPGFCLLAKLVC